MTTDGHTERETQALLALLAMGDGDIEAGRTRSLGDVAARLRGRNKVVR